MALAQLMDKIELGPVRVLILINEDVAELLLVLNEDLRIGTKEVQNTRDETPEVDGIATVELSFVLEKNIEETFVFSKFLDIGRSWKPHVIAKVLKAVDVCCNCIGRKLFKINPTLIQEGLNDGLGLAIIVDGEVPGKSEVGCLHP